MFIIATFWLLLSPFRWSQIPLTRNHSVGSAINGETPIRTGHEGLKVLKTKHCLPNNELF